MSTYDAQVTALDWRSSYVPSWQTGGELKKEEAEPEIIEITDSKKIELALTGSMRPKSEIIPFLSSIGVLPDKTLLSEMGTKLVSSVLISTALSVWVSNSLLMQVFVVVAILDFIVKIFTDKVTTIRQKIAYLLNGFLLVGVVATAADILFKQVDLVFGLKFSVLPTFLWLMISSYLYAYFKMGWKNSILKDARLPVAIVLSARAGWEKFTESLSKELTDDVKK